MQGPIQPGGSFSYSTALRQELSWRSRQYASRLGLERCESYGKQPVVCYLPSADATTHGNFLPQTYRAIVKNPEWRRRLDKPHTSARQVLPRSDRSWRELDSCASSDALLMNVFCFPGTLKQKRVMNLLGVEHGSAPQFGFRARVPLANGHADGTEVDMRLGNMLVEAKLTERDFQSKAALVVESYRDVDEVFDLAQLARRDGVFLSYQLIRNVLAAHANGGSFCVMMDARRPDMREAWYAVMRCVRPHDLRLRCKMLTWQELAAVLPSSLQKFLDGKYGIAATGQMAAAS
jgi:hypothetical protein